MTRVGVIGCGFFAGNHLNAWKQLASEGVELVAVCDMDASKARAAAEAFGIAGVYSDAAAMLAAEKLDLVDIVTQVRSHRPLVELCLNAGVPTIVQKPFGLSLDDCVAMRDLSERLGVPLAVHENFRFQAPLQLAKEILHSGEIGEANWARINFRTAHDIYTGQPYLRTEQKLVINDLGVHVLDVARFFLGEAKHISAETQHRRPDIAGEDTATMLVRHESGAVSVAECTYDARRLPDLFPQVLLELEGTRGSVVVKADYEVVVTANGAARTIMAEPDVQPWMRQPWNVVQDSVVATCAHILQAYRAGEMPGVSAADNVKTIALCEAAYEAAERGVAVVPRG
ncbi:MAG: Oxidoreductase [Devosia sp.]|uniref:Gfo/Idh/MocA family protein n=1 Tax=Devosia sp. TaxID=1871048 RepID=UPI00261EFE8C|nr:Gfo/Idh/MocA family oxidoreductase [Devosia sp.]MDB5531195.1 Oxidoreductase [Devosia sp.]